MGWIIPLTYFPNKIGPFPVYERCKSYFCFVFSSVPSGFYSIVWEYGVHLSQLTYWSRGQMLTFLHFLPFLIWSSHLSPLLLEDHITSAAHPSSLESNSDGLQRVGCFLMLKTGSPDPPAFDGDGDKRPHRMLCKPCSQFNWSIKGQSLCLGRRGGRWDLRIE